MAGYVVLRAPISARRVSSGWRWKAALTAFGYNRKRFIEGRVRGLITAVMCSGIVPTVTTARVRCRELNEEQKKKLADLMGRPFELPATLGVSGAKPGTPAKQP